MTPPAARPWPARPLFSAGWSAAWALVLAAFADNASRLPLRDAAPVFAFALAVLGALVMDRERVRAWSGLCVVAAALLTVIAAHTAHYNHDPSLFEWPLLAGVLSVAIAVPVFQTVNEQARWSLPYGRLHVHAWTDAVVFAAASMFVGLAFALAYLLAALFDLIGLRGLTLVLQQSSFNWLLAGLAFGASAGLLRERAVLVVTLQRLVMVVLAVLAPVLAVGLACFLMTLPLTGLESLWRATSHTTPLMLISAASAVLLGNAVIGHGGDGEEARGRLQRASAWLLAVTVLPLALIAAVSLAQRIAQHGWTPDRSWAVVVTVVAGCYGLAYLAAVVFGGHAWQAQLRRANVALALSIAVLAVMLALPVIDFGAIATRDQLARHVRDGAVDERFDWRAFAFDFGPSGRAALEELAAHGSPEQRAAAHATLAAQWRWASDIPGGAEVGVRPTERVTRRLRVMPRGTEAEIALRRAIGAAHYCQDDAAPCFAVRLAEDRFLVGEAVADRLRTGVFLRGAADAWRQEGGDSYEPVPDGARLTGDAEFELRDVQRRELFVNGRASGVVVE